jgi:hypothetical protein
METNTAARTYNFAAIALNEAIENSELAELAYRETREEIELLQATTPNAEDVPDDVYFDIKRRMAAAANARSLAAIHLEEVRYNQRRWK